MYCSATVLINKGVLRVAKVGALAITRRSIEHNAV